MQKLEFYQKNGEALKLKLKLEKEIVRKDLDAELLEGSPEEVGDIFNLPAVRIAESMIFQRCNFEDDQSFVRAVILQMLRGARETASEIIVPIDFSDAAENALRYALAIANLTQSKLKLVHAFAPVTSTSADGMVYFDPDREEKRSSAWQDTVALLKAKYQKELRSLPGDLLADFLVGQPAEILEELSDDPKTKMIIIGSTGAGSAVKTFFGSVSTHVAMHAHCPVMIIPPSSRFQSLDLILFANDQPVADRELIRTVRNLCGAKKAKIHAVRIYEKATNYVAVGEEEIESGSEDNIEESIVFRQDLVESLNEFALRNEIDLVTVINRRRSFLQKLFHVSTSKKMAANSSIPLLVLHELDAVMKS